MYGLLIFLVDTAIRTIIVSWVEELVVGLSKTESPHEDENAHV